MTKLGSDKVKSRTATVRATVTMEQKNVIEKLIGVLGSNEQDVVSKILTLWIYNEGFLKSKVGPAGRQGSQGRGAWKNE